MQAPLLLLITLACWSLGQESELHWDALTRLKPVDPFKNCNQSMCDLPCAGAGWPPFCPKEPLRCATGCACVALCPTADEDRTIICYETKYCLSTRRRFLRRRTTLKSVN